MTTATLQTQVKTLGDPTRDGHLPSHRPGGPARGVRRDHEPFPFNLNAIRQHLVKLVAAGRILESTARAAGHGWHRLVHGTTATVTEPFALVRVDTPRTRTASPARRRSMTIAVSHLPSGR